MSTVHDPMKEIISLHGLGFIQVQLQGEQRLHVWHPDLPRRRCFDHSAIHNHRFSFDSHVLVGEQININYQALDASEETATHRLYVHEGPRSANGGRPWTPNAAVMMQEGSHQTIPAGLTYRMFAYEFHRTLPGGDGRVATLMSKTGEGKLGAMSSCLIGVEPDTDFDRFQLSSAELWAYVIEVLGGTQAANPTSAQREAERLNFMLEGARNLVIERLPSHDSLDNLLVYVEEGFLSERRYPSIAYQGDWAAYPDRAAAVKRRAIDAAMIAYQRGEVNA